MQARVETWARAPAANVWIVAAGMLLATAAAVLLTVPTGIRQPVLVGLVGIVTAAPLVARGIQGRWDPFEPIAIICIGGFVLFFLRPLWMWIHDQWILGPYDARDGLTGATTIALAGFTSLIAAYRLDLGRRLASRVPAVADDWDPSRVALACFGILVVAALLFTMFIGTSGGFAAVKNYFSGRDNALTTTLVGNPNGPRKSAYLYLAPYMSLPVSLMLLEVWHRQRKPLYAALGVFTLALVLLMTIPRGDRTYILALALPLIAIFYLGRGRRPRALSIVVAILVTMIVANALLQFRAKETRDSSLPTKIARSATHPLGAVNDFMLGPDVSMLTILAAEYQAVPQDLKLSPARTMTAMLAEPVPGTFWRGKPQDPQQDVYATLFPNNAAAIKAGFASSMLGSFYADSAFVGVIVYCFLLGIAFRVLFEYWRQNQTNRSVIIVYAAMLPLLIILLRANPAATLGLWVILVAPILVAFWWGARTEDRPRAARSENAVA